LNTLDPTDRLIVLELVLAKQLSSYEPAHAKRLFLQVTLVGRAAADEHPVAVGHLGQVGHGQPHKLRPGHTSVTTPNAAFGCMAYRGWHDNRRHPQGSAASSMMSNPRCYVFAETLRDGTAVTVRAARVEDGPKIRRAFQNLDRDTVYTRFFGYKADVSGADLARITGADFETTVALLVTTGAGTDEVVVGGASYVVESSATTAGRSAEVAFLVEEDFQGRGIASSLMRHIIAIARANGLDRLEADVLARNHPMLNVFRRCGLPMEVRRAGDVVHAILSLREQG
jgi:GNAT superfamily N-acetyltransferase